MYNSELCIFQFYGLTTDAFFKNDNAPNTFRVKMHNQNHEFTSLKQHHPKRGRRRQHQSREASSTTPMKYGRDGSNVQKVRVEKVTPHKRRIGHQTQISQKCNSCLWSEKCFSLYFTFFSKRKKEKKRKKRARAPPPKGERGGGKHHNP